MLRYVSVLLFRSRKILAKRTYTSGLDLVRPVILGIESSCDDTGAAIVNRNGVILGESLHSQHKQHLRYNNKIYHSLLNLKSNKIQIILDTEE